MSPFIFVNWKPFGYFPPFFVMFWNTITVRATLHGMSILNGVKVTYYNTAF